MIQLPVTEEQKDAMERTAGVASMMALAGDQLDAAQIERVFSPEKRGDLIVRLADTIVRFARGDKFADEEVGAEEYVYPKKFGKAPKSVMEQVGILRLFFPDLTLYPGYSNKLRCPQTADGLYVIPDWRRVADMYAEACVIAIAHLRKMLGLKFREAPVLFDFSDAYQRRNVRTEEMLEEARLMQHTCDLFILPAQFGIAHAGRSPRRVTEALARTEFHLGVFEVACMLLTHPEQFGCKNPHWIGCAGDERTMYNPEDPAREILAFAFLDGKIGPGIAYVGRFNEDFGCATGFLPQLM